MSPTYGSFFSGGGFADIGAKAAGYALTFANEIDPQIAAVYRENLGDHIIVGDVLNLDIDALPYVDLFHASPVCTRASIANKNRGESALDIATAQKTADYIRAKLPAKVTIENVSQYRDFKAYRILIDTLDACGYWRNAEILNSADFGVPQTRRRLVVRAVRSGFVPYLPEPVKWIGWYEAIADLIDTLPDDKFPKWQAKKLPKEIHESVFFTKSELTQTRLGDTYEPRSWVLPEPTITASDFDTKEKAGKAFLIDGQNSSTVVALENETPFVTVSACQKGVARAWLSSGRVVRMTPRALARFQSVPDWYRLPENNKLAGRIIGNGVPSLMYQRIAESLL